jgi:hypothetical protein
MIGVVSISSTKLAGHSSTRVAVAVAGNNWKFS